MDEEDGEDLSSPFWLPSSGNKRRRNDRIRHSLSSLIFNSGLLILLLLIAALSFLYYFILPSTISIFDPNSVKKSWDSLNLILVVVALLLGFLCRNKTEDIAPENDQPFRASSPIIRNEYRNGEESKSNQLQSPHKWYDYSDQNRSVSSRDMFMRTSTSYPDLRQVPSEQMEFGDDPWRFSDDINWGTGTGQFLRRRRSWKDKDKSDDVRFSDDIYWGTTGGTGQQQRLPSWKEKSADKTPIQISSREADASPPPLHPPLTSASHEEKPKRLNGDKRGRNRRRSDIEVEIENIEPISPVVTAPPPPPPPPIMPQFSDLKSTKRILKKRSGENAKDYVNSLILYQKKKRKERQRTVDNFDYRYHQPLSQPPSPPPQPPPPPPPPPPPVTFNRSTRKRKDAVNSASSGTTTSQFLTVAVNVPLPKAVAVSNYYNTEESSNSGGESPVIHIPPPPPPPPSFSKSLGWKFALQGDYVRVNSTGSSRSVSPEPYDADSDRTPMAGDSDDATTMTASASSLFFPSPDVDTKADKFISNFWAGLKLEKIDSLNKKHGLGLSNLGPGSGPTQK